MGQSANVRTLHSALIVPGPAHVLGLFSLSAEHTDIAVASGISSSLLADYVVKVTGVTNIKIGILSKIPHVRHHALEPHLVLRALRLNCLIRPYAPLWEELYNGAWREDSWVPGIGLDRADRKPIGEVGRVWEWETPLRRAADRRQALVEIDAIVAIMLGVTADELLTIYRTQFPVLQKYERDALYDAAGRQLSGKLASEYRKKGYFKIDDKTVHGVKLQEPFNEVDRERDMRLAHEHFSEFVGANIR